MLTLVNRRKKLSEASTTVNMHTCQKEWLFKSDWLTGRFAGPIPKREDTHFCSEKIKQP